MAIVLRFSTSLWPDSKLIQVHTTCPISHVEFERDDLWTFGSRLDGGVKMRPPSESSQDCVIRATFDKIQDAYNWAVANRDGWEYDITGILGIAEDRDVHDEHGVFCSELARNGNDAVGGGLVFSTLLAAWHTTPRDVLVAPGLTILSKPAGLVYV